MKRILVISILTLGLLRSYAQGPTYNSLQLGWGIGHLMRQDLTVSPFIHRDWSPVQVFLNYSRSRHLEHQVTVRFSSYSPTRVDPYSFNSFYNGHLSTLPHSFKMVDIDYALGKELLQDPKWSLIVGGKSRNFLFASDYYFGESGPSPVFISFGLDIWLKAKLLLNDKSYLASQASIPVFSYVYRDPYLTQDDQFFEMIYSHNGLKQLARRIEDGEWRSWGNAQRVELHFHYGYIINPKWELGLGYRFAMNLNQYPTRFTQLENTFLVSGTLNF